MKKLIIILILSLSINTYSQWIEISAPTTENLIDIYFKNNNIGFCIGSNGVILKTTDTGNNWSIIQQNANINYTNIIFYNNKLVAFGVENGVKKYFYSFDEGLSWSSENITFIPVPLHLLNNDLYYTDFNTSNLYRFNDNQPILIASDVGIYGVNNSTNELIYVNYLYNIIRKSIDYGQNWQEIQTFPSGFSQNQSTNAVIKPFNDKIVIHHTYPNHTIFSNDNGVTWTINTDDVDTDFTKIINETTIYSIRTNNIAITQNLINWQTLLEDNIQKRNIYFFNDNLGFILRNNGLLYRTENGGLSIDNQILEKKIKIYPNPVKNSIKIEFTDIEIKKIELININGKLIKSFSSNFTELKICNVSKGSYILKIETENGILNKKLLIK